MAKLAHVGGLSLALAVNPTHFGNPINECRGDELELQIYGLHGDLCAPSCSDAPCPTDVPAGVTAVPTCALTDGAGEKWCVLVCDPAVAGQCGSDWADCQAKGDTAVCMYENDRTASAKAAETQLTVAGSPAGTLHERQRQPRGAALPAGWSDAGVGFCECRDGQQFGQGSDMPYRSTIPQRADVQSLETCLAAAVGAGALAADWNDGYKYCNLAFATTEQCKAALPDWNDSCEDGPPCDLTKYAIAGGQADGGVECYTYSSSVV